MLLFLLQIYLNSPLGSLPETWEKYKESIDINKNTFKCFTENKVINLSQVNDNYLDCIDGSDEPGTAVLTNGKFYCKNEGNSPKIINSWSVNDGICDCCDGSDELLNPHASCSNICGPNKENSSFDNTSFTNKKPQQYIKNQENPENKTDEPNNIAQFKKEHEIKIIQENITEKDINKIKFRYQTINWSFIEYILISLWKDPL